MNNACLTLVPNVHARLRAHFRGVPVYADDFSQYLQDLLAVGYGAFNTKADDLLSTLAREHIELMKREGIGFYFPIERRWGTRFINHSDLFTETGERMCRGTMREIDNYLRFHALDDTSKIARRDQIVDELLTSPFVFDPVEASRIAQREIRPSQLGLAPDFSTLEDVLYLGNPETSIARVRLTGYRGLDDQVANKRVGIEELDKLGELVTPLGFVWHHLDDFDPITGDCTMQLIMRELHWGQIYGPTHTGGTAIWKRFFEFVSYRN